MQRRSTGVAAAVALCATALSATAQPLPHALYACTSITSDSERLACYDREIAALTRDKAGHAAAVKSSGPRVSSGAPGAAAAPAAGAAPAPLTPEQRMGLSAEAVSRLEAKPGAESAAPKSLTAHIAGVSRNAAGRLVFTLDNGQVWRQTENKDSFETAPGDAVTISAGALGSFWLATNNHNRTRVERLPPR